MESQFGAAASFILLARVKFPFRQISRFDLKRKKQAKGNLNLQKGRFFGMDNMIKKASLADMMDIYALANEKSVRQNSINTEPISLQTHKEWFLARLNNKNCLIYVYRQNDELAGVCRIEKEQDGDFWVVSIDVAPKFRHQGIATKLLNSIINKHKTKNFLAFVRTQNTKSAGLFTKLGFKLSGKQIQKDVELLKFVKITPKYVIAISNKLYNSTNLMQKDAFYICKKGDFNIKTLKKLNPKLVFLPHWSYIVPKEIYETYPCVIFHMSDLPFGRGGSPLQNLLIRGIYNTKITALKCTNVLDGGDIYLKRDFDISYGSAADIYKRAGEVISDMIDEMMHNDIILKPQKGNVVEFKRRRAEQSDISKLDFDTCSKINKAYDFIRMLDAPGYPKAFLRLNGLIFEISAAKLKDGKLTAKLEIKEENEDNLSSSSSSR